MDRKSSKRRNDTKTAAATPAPPRARGKKASKDTDPAFLAPAALANPPRKRARAGAPPSSAQPSSARAETSHAETPLPPKTRVAIADAPGQDKFALLESALRQAGFREHLAAACQRGPGSPDAMRILIKPDFSVFEAHGATGTDPALVEHLIDLLHAWGYTNAQVCEGPNSFDLWLENRDVLVLAEMIGYRFVTPAGNSYDVLDLSEDVIPLDFPAGSALHGAGLARVWVEADYRICFARNKTDEEEFYALGLHNLAGALPLRDKDYHYRHRLDPRDVASELLRRTPAHFSVIDASVSNHGGAGARVSHPLATATMIASSDLLLADWAAARKMGLDPYVSRRNAAALREIGLPVAYEVAGSLAPYPGWINVHPLMADSVRRRNRSLTVMRLLAPWLQTADPALFPFRDVLNERLNNLLARNLSRPDEQPGTFWATVALNYALGAAHDGVTTYQTLFDKDRLRWREAPLNIDLLEHRLTEYEAIVDYLAPLANLVADAPADREGLRWCDYGKSVLFSFSRVIPAPYDDFVARVAITEAIQLMNDYIGGVAVPVAHDADGRVTHQAERNLYLPQPNYLALYQGEIIDVTKLEYIVYEAGARRIYWRTVKSANASAEYDDGMVTFARTEAGETLVTIMGRQLFTLPVFWKIVNLELNPMLREYLVANAYSDFFTRTLNNFEAKYEGREIRIGRAWNHEQGEPGAAANERMPAEVVAELLGRAGAAVNRNWDTIARFLPRKYQTEKSAQGPAQGPGPDAGAGHGAVNGVARGVVDEDGFTHVRPPSGDAFVTNGVEDSAATETEDDLRRLFNRAKSGSRTFFKDLTAAVKKDLGRPGKQD
ncbi:MAG: DUF362 domain-containing protein [Blastocatellia bacterium]